MTLQRDLPRSPRARPGPPNRAALALLLGIVGFALTMWGFLAGIDAALDASGSGPGAWVAVFLVGLLGSLAAMVLAVLGLISGTSRVMSGIALVIALLPGIGMFVIAVAARS